MSAVHQDLAVMTDYMYLASMLYLVMVLLVMPQWVEPWRHTVVNSCVCVCISVCMSVTCVSQRLLQARHWPVQSGTMR